ncbi:hypothetical protein ACWGH3_35020 [Streptomyces sp. NPDC054884]|uniref:hypothetical protein n=1 Tax=Streptomyces sp. ME08-AFT2 TaxID=3028683 RepID=UPI0029B41554|nr:hypothetical protein [Streptomyces sp. ME08-AFT2]MDX3312770.1 hypothetical protein [Streptomyces sp. ME08-AFT2]
MLLKKMADSLGDRILGRLVPSTTADADEFECTYEYRCTFPYCGSVRLSRFRRQVCAEATGGPSKGPWERMGCC